MLGWLEYNLKRALGLEGTGEKDQHEGIQQTISTISEKNLFQWFGKSLCFYENYF